MALLVGCQAPIAAPDAGVDASVDAGTDAGFAAPQPDANLGYGVSLSFRDQTPVSFSGITF